MDYRGLTPSKRASGFSTGSAAIATTIVRCGLNIGHGPLTHTRGIPRELENKKIILRPIRPEDAELEQAFIHELSSQAKYYRFMGTINELSTTMLIRFTQIDYDKEMAFVASYRDERNEKIIGIARYIINPDGETAEFAIVIVDSWQNKGVGSKLLAALISVAKDKSIKSIEGVVLTDNTGMLELAKYHGFVISNNDDPTVKLIKKAIE